MKLSIRLKPFRNQFESNEKMTLVPQAAAAVFLLILTLCFQCAGVAALVEWLRGVTAKGGQGFGPGGDERLLPGA